MRKDEKSCLTLVLMVRDRGGVPAVHTAVHHPRALLAGDDGLHLGQTLLAVRPVPATQQTGYN